MPKISKEKKDALKKEMLQTLEKTLGVVNTACKVVGLSRSSFYDWCKEDLEFKAKVDEMNGIALDFVESKLFSQIKANNVTSIIFYLKTKGKSRGYVERIETATAPKDELDGKTEDELLQMLQDLKNG